MKYFFPTLALTAAFALPAHAAQPPPANWTAYIPSNQTCKASPFAPAKMIEMIRRDFLVTPETDDTTDPTTGKITATVLSFHDTDKNLDVEIRMFRTLADCNAYAATQREPAGKYD